MIESNIVEGRQDVVAGSDLVYGQSITDACLGWDDTVQVIDQLAAAVDTRRSLSRQDCQLRVPKPMKQVASIPTPVRFMI